MDVGLPPGWRRLTWDIGTKELQRSVLAIETYELLRQGLFNTRKQRSRIRQKRKIMAKEVTEGTPNTHPDNKFVNEHAWVQVKMIERGMIDSTDQKTHEMSPLLPGADKMLPILIRDLVACEPIIWKPDP